MKLLHRIHDARNLFSLDSATSTGAERDSSGFGFGFEEKKEAGMGFSLCSASWFRISEKKVPPAAAVQADTP